MKRVSIPPQLRMELPRAFLLAFLLLAMAAGWFLLVDYRNTERELRGLLESNAISLAESIAQTARLSLQSSAILQQEASRHLLAAARLIAHLDEEGRLSIPALQQTARDLNLFRVHVLDSSGRMIRSNVAPAPGCQETPNLPPEILQPLLGGKVREIILGIRESRFGEGSRFAVAVARKGGGAIIVNIEGRTLEQYRRQAGLGQAVARMASSPSIAYLIIQDDDGPISVSPGVKVISAIDEDPGLKNVYQTGTRKTRFIQLNGKEILETIIPFDLERDYKTLFRVGMDLSFYHSQLAALKRRELLMGGVFLLGCSLLVGLIHMVQNYRYLHSRHMQALAMAGHITENMLEALIVVDGEGAIVRFNQKAGELFALEESSTLPPGLAPVLESGDKPCNAGHPCDIQWQDKTFMYQRQALPAAGGPQPQGLTLHLLRDVTEQRAMEQRLQREERLAALGRLVSAMAHEIRNPLNALSLSVQTLQRRLKSTENEKDKATLGVIREEIQRLNNLVEDFLTLARPPVRERRAVAVAALLDRVRHLFAEDLAGRGGIRLEWDVNPTVIVSADENNLFRVLVNLVKNSLEMMDHGGSIHISTCLEDGHVCLNVRDTGPGFSAEALARGIEPFFSTRDAGTGLGLSLSAEIVRGHGWDLRLGNHPDGGALVSIIIPQEDIR